jgi:hypothetical protein
MKYLKLIILMSFLISAFACEEKENKSDFTNKLTFGTSINYSDFTLGGESASFSVTPGNVSFRLESEEDFNGNPIKFVILKNGSAYSTDIHSTNPTPTGHIFMTTKNYAQTGTYSVTAYIQKTGGDKTIANASFTMN